MHKYDCIRQAKQLISDSLAVPMRRSVPKRPICLFQRVTRSQAEIAQLVGVELGKRLAAVAASSRGSLLPILAAVAVGVGEALERGTAH